MAYTEQQTAAAYEAFQNWMEGSNGETYRTRKNLDRVFENIKRKSRSAGNDVSSAERGTAANGNVRVSVEERGSNGAGNSGTGAENRRVNTKFSLKEYSDQEKRDHRKEAIAYFGKTYNWNETGYLTPAGTKLDFSGRHEGGPGGYRTVDHRDIRDAIGEDYGGDDYSGSMVQFMSEGNIRISPESGGINLSVEPTKSQLDALSDFISKNRGEVILDLDTTDVVIDTRKNGSILLYDVLNLQPTSFAEKETDAATSTNSSPRTARSTASVSTYIL